ncbi:ubinuclein-1-like isoform X2 [Silene latifolia]|uniref:ubinuclein-1-like isoform X2 n=1 Tax=Silene latifolia TaxID=37657 RepID=UPI003D77C704
MSEERNAAAGTSAGAGGESAATTTAGAPRVASSYVKDGDRVKFTVELRAGETTIVSWKKLMKDASKAEGGGGATSSSAVAAAAAVAPAEVPAAAAIPALEARIAPGQPDANPNEDAPAPHRFSAVIEKIERLYMGKDSSDEEDLNDIPDDDQYDTEDSFIDDAELDEYFQVDKSKTKHDGYFVNRGTLEKVIEPPEPANQQKNKGKRKEMIKGAGNSDDGQRPIKHMKTTKRATVQSLAAEKRVLPTSDGSSATKSEEEKFQNHHKIAADSKPPLDPSLRIHHDKDASGNGDRVELTHKSHSLINSFEESELVMQQKDKSTMRESIDLNLPDTKHLIQPVNSAMHKKEGSSVKSKVNVLEKAIRELEKMVAESRPPAPDAHDGDSSSQSVKRRLPREIKQKLAKVARLSHASNDMVSKELLSRLMGIVGHLCQVRTLKRHLKVMVTTSLSAKQEKDDKFQLIKKEVVEMVKARIPSLLSKATDQQSGGSGDLLESGHLEKVAKGQHFMDATLEDKICDLYDTFVDGLDEDVAPQVRKLYAELAELWPKGIMDNHGIKRAICRAKERKRTLSEKNKDQEKIRRKKVVSMNTGDTVRLESNIAAQSQYVDPNTSVLSQHNCFPTSFGAGTVTNPASTIPAFTSLKNVPYPDRPKQEKVKGTHNSSLPDARIVNGFHTGVKKKKKRAESLVGEDHMRPEKLSSHQHKHPAESLQGGPHNSSSVEFRFEPLM